MCIRDRIGPKDFPFMLKKIGSWIGSAKKYVADIQNQVSDITDEKFDKIDEQSNDKKTNDKVKNDK